MKISTGAIGKSTLLTYIKENKGKKMTIEFIKRTTNEYRVMECYLTAAKNCFPNGKATFSHAAKGLVPVMEVVEGHRKLTVKELKKVAICKSIPLDGVRVITIDKQSYRVVDDYLLQPRGAKPAKKAKATKKPRYSTPERFETILMNAMLTGRF